MADDRSGDRLLDDWVLGLKATVLARAGAGAATGGAEAAADLVAGSGWSEGTWKNRLSQVRRWLAFCDEDDRTARPASEGDVLAYIGYLSLDGRVGPVSARHYVSAVSRYHEDGGFESPTKTRLVKAVLDAYAKKVDAEGEVRDTRVGCPAGVMRRIVEHGLSSTSTEVVGCCAMAVFAFVFQCRSISVARLKTSDISISGGVMSATLHRKGERRHTRPHRLSYGEGGSVEHSGMVVRLMKKWETSRPQSTGFFDLATEVRVGSANLRTGLCKALEAVGEVAERGFFYGSHSPRIGGFNELVKLGFSRAWLMHRLDWASETMFQVYFDSRIVTTPDSEWFFAHLRRGY